MNKKQNLTTEQKSILFEEATEPSGSSPLNNKKREGSYHCVGCGTKLFNSSSKYERFLSKVEAPVIIVFSLNIEM